MAQTQPNAPETNQNGKPTPPRNAIAATTGAEENAGPDPIALLTADHRHVEQLFNAFEKATNSEQKTQIAKQICTELVIHTMIEEEIFYPACQGHVERRLLDEAQVEHDGTKALIIEIQIGSPDDPYYDAKVKVLSEDVKHHVREEEKPGDGILAKAKEAGIATGELAGELAARKQKLTDEAKAGALGPPETRSFRARTEAGANQAAKELQMARGSSSTMERDRDERGRFVSDDDDDRDYRRRSSGRSRQDDGDDDDRRSSRSRDEDGRFTSSRSRSRDDDDDDRRGGSRDHGQGGWFGDPGGNSRASREGWEERGGSRSRSRDDDDDRRSSRSRDDEGRFTSSRSRSRDDDDDDDRRSSRSRDDEGRFTSSRSRSRDDDDDDRRGGSRDHGQGGWFGDPEGHSRASREGREERGGSRSRSRDDDDDRRSYRSRDDEGRFTSTRSRSRDDDDDDRRGGSRDRGQGGWFGDPEGHSRAAREGREDRGGSRYRDDDDDRRSSPARDEEGRFTSSRSRSRDDDDRRGGSRDRGHGGWFGDPEGHAEAARQRRR